MPTFRFTAWDSQGRKVHDSLRADDRSAAASQLRERGLCVDRLEAAEGEVKPPIRGGAPATLEEHIEGAAQCPACESVYSLAERRSHCDNCGAALPPPVVATGGAVQREYVGVLAFLKPFGDSTERRMREQGRFHDVGGQSLKMQVEGAVTCGWCGRKYPHRDSNPNCGSCGGVLPLPPSADPGAPPPPAPRPLPKQFLYKLFVRQNVGGWAGAAMIAVSLPLLFAVPLFGLLLLAIGGLAAYINFVAAYRRRCALEQGEAVLGRVEGVHMIGELGNPKNLYRVTYRFEADGKPAQAMKHTYDPTVTQHFVGEPVWVVYLQNRPTHHALWPPLA